MIVFVEKAAVLWTGGKDCALAMDEAVRSGVSVTCLATFAPEDAQFLAHPLEVMQAQAKALQLPHHLLRVQAPFEQSYEDGLRELRDKHGVTCVVTGDIDEVEGYPNWIRQRAAVVGMPVLTPLWGRDRRDLLELTLARGFEVIFSCVKQPWLDHAWLGRTITPEAIEELKSVSQRTGLDLCGENGEYHTLVLAGPGFSQRVSLRWETAQSGEVMSFLAVKEIIYSQDSNSQ